MAFQIDGFPERGVSPQWWRETDPMRVAVRGSIAFERKMRNLGQNCYAIHVMHVMQNGYNDRRIERQPTRNTSDMFHSKQLHQSENEESRKAPNGGHDESLRVRRACTN